MKVAILGYGREGRSLERFLKRSRLSLYRRAEIEILDCARDENYLRDLKRFDFIFRSPGVPYNLPELKRARQAGVSISSATKLFFDLCPAKIVGITGTKGKGTVATLLYKILRAAGRDAYLVGNIGKPALDCLSRLKKSSIVVYELSSFQLQDLNCSPALAVVLDLFPDHQDHHRSLREYYSAKENIARYQKAGDKIFVFRDSSRAQKIAALSRGQVSEVKAVKQIPERNFIMAVAVSQALGVGQTIIAKGRKNFRGLPQRLELVRRLGQIKFINDSAATNPTAAARAVATFAGQQIILIHGGQNKNLPPAPLEIAIKKYCPALVIPFSNLRVAVTQAYRFARERRGDWVVLFSPGAASFNLFNNYEERGEIFKRLVRNL